MGIQDLFKFFKNNCPEQILDLHLSVWRGYSFAVDISIFLNKFIKSAGDGLWMNTFFMFLCNLKKHGIKAVCIFDGPNPPPEKKAEQQSRKDGSEKAVNRMNDAIIMRNMLRQCYLQKNKSLPVDLQEKCQLLIGKKKVKEGYIVWSEPSEVYDALTDLIKRLTIQTSPITNVHREKAWEITRMMGLPTFQYDGEAEALCAYMAIHGYVDAVLSEDTDVLAYGTPWMVAFKEYKLRDEKVRCVYLPDVLDAVGYTMDEFRDLCILLSCDYNSRARLPPKKGKETSIPVGCVRATKLINTFRRLEVIEPYLLDASLLIYPRCRTLFTPISEEELKLIIQERPYTSKPEFEKIRQFILKENLTVSIEHIEKCWKPIDIIIHEDEESIEDVANEDDYYVILSVRCEDDDGNVSLIKVNAIFRDEDQFALANDSGFDFYIENVNEWLNKFYPGFHVDDTIECEDVLLTKPDDKKLLDLRVVSNDEEEL